MAKDNNLSDFLKDIADALREKLGIIEPINPQEFSTLIRIIGEYEPVEETVDRIINEIPSLVANGTLTDPKWAKVSTLKGNSVVWNQLIGGCSPVYSYEGVTTLYDSNTNEMVVQNISQTTNYTSGSSRGTITPTTNLIVGHKYYLWANKDVSGIGITTANVHADFINVGTLFVASQTHQSNDLWFRITKDYDFETLYPIGSEFRIKMALYDLTQMFGAGNEPTTIEEFESRKPIGVTNDYNEGEIISYQQWGEKVVWNQLVGSQSDTTKYYTNNCTVTANDNIFTVNVSNSSNGFSIKGNDVSGKNISPTEGHKYLIMVDIRTSEEDKVVNFGTMNVGAVVRPNFHCICSLTSIWQTFSIFTPEWTQNNNYGIPRIGSLANDTYTKTFDFRNLVLIDLTLMFGAGNEPTTIEEFERRRPRNVSNDYNEGTEINGDISLVSVANDTTTTIPLPNVSTIVDADGNQLFPYGLCSAGSVYDEITETKAIKRVGVTKIGELEYIMQDTSGFYFNVDDIKSYHNITALPNIMTAKYSVAMRNTMVAGDKIISMNNGSMWVVMQDKAFTDSVDFIAANKDTLLYYELNTPIEVEINKWKAEYKVEQGGTEQIVSENDTTNLKTDIIYGYNKLY